MPGEVIRSDRGDDDRLAPVRLALRCRIAAQQGEQCRGQWNQPIAAQQVSALPWKYLRPRNRVVTGLRARADAVGLITWDVSVDSTINRAHQHAAGARNRAQDQKEPPGGVETEPDDHALGRSRGGWTTKLHLGCEQGQTRVCG
jgi:hypothetical protein